MNIEDDILLSMINAAIAAGRAIENVKKSSSYAIHSKSDNSPVTDADYASQHTIVDMISHLPIPMISEEEESMTYEIRKEWKEVFIIDPLDGTGEFINGTDEYGVNIALCRDGIPVTGVIYLPSQKELYYGSENITAQKAVIKDTVISFSSIEDIESCILPLEQVEKRGYICLASKSRRSEETIAYYESLKKEKADLTILPVGSCVKYCHIASGEADEYTRFGSVKEWDTAAGDALLRSMGMPLVDIHTGKPLLYNKEILNSSDFTVKRK
jgi:3'(2'), 5'-bisphosphate nucleotidase